MLLALPDEVNNSMEDLKIKFDGETNQIEANTLINSLLHFTNIVHEVNRDLETGRKIEIKINAFDPGSFIVDILIQARDMVNGLKSLFTNDNLSTASNIVTVVGGLYGLAKFLKNGDPKVIESNDTSTKIENVKGDVTYIDNRVVNIYQNNKVIREAIAHEFDTLEKDPKVTGFELLGKNDEKIVEIKRDEFSDLASSEDNTTILPNEQLITKQVTLNIYTLSFDKNIKWTFVYENNKISAKISDDFALRIDNGEKFAKGDSLVAVIEIKQQFDKIVNAYINKSYRIVKIINHIPRSEQGKLGLS